MTANCLMKLVRQQFMLRCWLRGQSLTFLTWASFCVSAEITVPIEKDFKIDSKEILPPPEFLNDNAPSGGHSHNCFASSAVIPSLPLAIKWLQDCVKEHPSTRLQVTKTWMVLGSYIDLANGGILLCWC